MLRVWGRQGKKHLGIPTLHSVNFKGGKPESKRGVKEDGADGEAKNLKDKGRTKMEAEEHGV